MITSIGGSDAGIAVHAPESVLENPATEEAAKCALDEPRDGAVAAASAAEEGLER